VHCDLMSVLVQNPAYLDGYQPVLLDPPEYTAVLGDLTIWAELGLPDNGGISLVALRAFQCRLWPHDVTLHVQTSAFGSHILRLGRYFRCSAQETDAILRKRFQYFDPTNDAGNAGRPFYKACHSKTSYLNPITQGA